MKKTSLFTLVVSCVSVFLGASAGAEWDNASQTAMEKTVELLTNPKMREAAIRGNPAAQKVDQSAEFIGDSYDKEKIYKLAAEIFQTQIKKHKGDGKALKDSLARDPGSVFESFTPEQQKAIRALASDIEKRKGPIAP
ncbi:MAG: hypothetical protein KDD61_05830 [Bdellovibrionales bacterium]|nr:hypothetical protein [Bdellovibrionales bacterium]